MGDSARGIAGRSVGRGTRCVTLSMVHLGPLEDSAFGCRLLIFVTRQGVVFLLRLRFVPLGSISKATPRFLPSSPGKEMSESCVNGRNGQDSREQGR